MSASVATSTILSDYRESSKGSSPRPVIDMLASRGARLPVAESVGMRAGETFVSAV